MSVAVQVCMKGTLFTPLSEHNTSTQSLNVQLRKLLDLQVNLVHGWTMPGVPSRFEDVDIVVIRYAPAPWHYTGVLTTTHALSTNHLKLAFRTGSVQRPHGFSGSALQHASCDCSSLRLPSRPGDHPFQCFCDVFRKRAAVQGEHRRRVQWVGARGCPRRCGVSEDHHTGDLHILLCCCGRPLGCRRST